jgi:hypothetical protein
VPVEDVCASTTRPPSERVWANKDASDDIGFAERERCRYHHLLRGAVIKGAAPNLRLPSPRLPSPRLMMMTAMRRGSLNLILLNIGMNNKPF